ncbi:MAG: efflux RND transporter periplasmic adaptor subunit [Fimbriimonadales bacterium]
MKAESLKTKPKPFIKAVPVLVVVLIGASLFWWLERGSSKSETGVEAPTELSLPEFVVLSEGSADMASLSVEVAPRSVLKRTLNLYGRIEPIAEQLVNLNSRVTGRVLELRARVGDTVCQGQIVAVLDSEEIHRAEIAYAQAQRKLEFARKELERRRRLAELGVYANPALEEARQRHAQAQSERHTAESEVRMAQQSVRREESALQRAQAHLQQVQRQLERAQTLRQAQLIAEQEYEAIQTQHATAQTEVRSAEAQLETARAQLESAQARLRSAQTQYELAQQHLERATALFKGQYLTTKEVAEAEALYREAELELESAKDELALLGGRPDGGHRLEVRAPFTGRITDLYVAVGETVTPDKPLMRLLNADAVWAAFEVYPDDAGLVKPGLSLQFKTNILPDRVFTAVVQQITPETDPNKQTLRLLCTVSNPQGLLKPNQFIEGQLEVAVGDPVVHVPAEAVHRIGEQRVVFVATDQPNRYAVREVVVGEPVSGRVPVQQGLKQGERVAVRNSALLKGILVGGGEE